MSSFAVIISVIAFFFPFAFCFFPLPFAFALEVAGYRQIDEHGNIFG